MPSILSFAAALVLLVVVVVVLRRGGCAPLREGFFWEDFDRPSERSNFSPDAPGSCGGTKRDRAADLEADALRVLAGM